MKRLEKLLWLAMCAAVAIGLSSCERKITRTEVVQQPATCFGCHSDTNTVLVAAQQQWEHSLHASGGTLNENDGTCKGCHTSEGFIARVTGATVPDEIQDPTAIHCFTCHAPHTNGDFRLRVTAPVTLANFVSYDLGEGNLCATCHQSRRDVSTYVTTRTTLSNRFGPHHGPQGDMLIGTNGYLYKNFTYEQTNHKSAVADGCIGCHMKTTSRYIVGGHSVNMVALEDSTVLNTAACDDCHGVHPTFDVDGVQTKVDSLVTDLQARLVTAGLMDAATGLPKSVSTSKDSAGAVWNLMLVKEDRSEGVHNAKYIIGLLRSSQLYIMGQLPQTSLVIANKDR